MSAASCRLVTFADRHYREARRMLLASAAEHGIAEVRTYGPSSLRVFSWARQNRHILSEPRGAGYWLWKPHLILENLLTLPADRFVLYCDAGAALVANPSSLLELCAKEGGILLFSVHSYLNRCYVKRDCFTLMGCDSERFWNAEQVNGAFMLFQAVPRAIAFVAEWVAWSDSLDLIIDAPNRLPGGNLPGFVAHRHDQSILSLLAEKQGILRHPDPSQWGEPFRRRPGGALEPYPTIFNHHRHRTLEWTVRLRIWLGALKQRLFARRGAKPAGV